ncbi:DUF11 domain-containing protein [Polaribacter sp. KT 15]|uniref:DUF11 domain-containing protein n=1 Tax=Polaribacter sp. KT 15 TaxID=1896175 RepID=UPI001560D91B|nr:DUF11 domain-containing protein [Polaribacter sp. KT 15]
MKNYISHSITKLKNNFSLTRNNATLLPVFLMLLFAFASTNTSLAQDTFETSFDSWVNIAGDQSNWVRTTGSTPSPNTGPTTGSGSATYIYYEATGGTTGDVAWIEKVYDFRGKENVQLVFDFHMWANSADVNAMGSLDVFVNHEGSLTNVFTITGNQGNNWSRTNPINLSYFDGKLVKLRFQSTRGTQFTSDIALDNINVTSQVSAPLDSDGDGVVDEDDLDDDNDGILDTEEGCETATSSTFTLDSTESLLGDVNSGGKLVYKDVDGNRVVLEAAGTVGDDAGFPDYGPNDGTVVGDISIGEIGFEIAGNDINDQPKLRVSAFSADGIPLKFISIGLGGISDMDNSTAQDAIAADVPGSWSNLTVAGNTLSVGQITTSPVGATPVSGVTQAQLNDFDFNNFVNQGAVSEVIFNIGNPLVEGDYNATFSPDEPTSSFNLIVDDIKINEGGIRNILTKLLTTTITIESIICRDTDGDGIPDNLDSDSDNDGCTDANEAYFGTTLRVDGDNDGFYGNGAVTVDGQGRVVGASYNTPNAVYLDETVSACYDTDNDGVPDSVDLDDDNDGILDSIECPLTPLSAAADASYYQSSHGRYFSVSNNINANGYIESGWSGAISEAGSVVVSESDFTSTTFSNGSLTISSDVSAAANTSAVGISVTNADSFISGASGSGYSIVPGDPRSETDQNLTTSVFINFTNPVYSFGFDLVDYFDHGSAGSFEDEWGIYADGKLIFKIGPDKSVGSGISGLVALKDGAGNFLSNITVGQNLETFIGFIQPRPVSTIEIRHSSTYITDSFGADNFGIDEFRYSEEAPCDFDKDGIPNYLDSDSDNDGCSDADEAYYNGLADADSDNNGFYGSGAPAVDAEGKVTTASYATPNAYYLNTAVITCDDNDKDGIPDAVDVDDDNDGILDTVEDDCNNTTLITNTTDWTQVDANTATRTVTVDGEVVTFTATLSNPVGLGGIFNGTNHTASPNIRLTYEVDVSQNSNLVTITSSNNNIPVALRFTDLDNISDYYQYFEPISQQPVATPAGWTSSDGLAALPGNPGNRFHSNELDADNDGADGVFYFTGSYPITLRTGTSVYGAVSGSTANFGIDVVVPICSNYDFDGDGIPNSLDTDSDNDGCPDAIEGAATLTLDKLSTFTGGSIGGSSQNLGANVDANGSPIVSGQGATGFTQASTNDVIDANVSLACAIDLNITKKVDKPILKIGETVIFTLVLTNSGPQPATNVQVRDLLPAGLTYNAASSVIATNTTYNPTTGIWDLSSLTIGVNDSVELKIAATINTLGVIITNNTEIFSTSETDKDSTPNSNN